MKSIFGLLVVLFSLTTATNAQNVVCRPLPGGGSECSNGLVTRPLPGGGTERSDGVITRPLPGGGTEIYGGNDDRRNARPCVRDPYGRCY